MKRNTVFLASLCAFSACWGGGGDNPARGPAYADGCQRFTSCASCTPVHGCGWCAYSRGGVCLSDPLACPAQMFTWTWEPALCTPGTDGSAPEGASSSDAEAGAATDATASEAAPGGASASCRWPAGANTFSAAPAASGCLPNVGPAFCAPSQYALTCYGSATTAISTPDATLKCVAASVSGPANAAVYCCPCS